MRCGAFFLLPVGQEGTPHNGRNHFSVLLLIYPMTAGDDMPPLITPKPIPTMKNINRWMAGIALLLWPGFDCGAAESDPLPSFPLNAEGEIEITGEGTTPLTRAESLERITEWMQTLGPTTVMELSADPRTGQISAPCGIVIAQETDEESTAIEYMSYTITVLCDDGRYAYRIGDVTAGITSWMDLDYDGSYELVSDDAIRLPDDYVSLLRTSESELEELRNELQELIGQDLSELTSNQLRRYEQKLQQTTEWFKATEAYTDMIRNNYMTCLGSLTATAEELTALLEQPTTTAADTDGISLDPLP